MSYKVEFDGYLYEDEYDTYEEAEEAALTMCSEYHQGAVDLYNENPGDFLEEGGDSGDPEYRIVESDD